VLRQVRAYLTAHGTDPDSIDVEMLHDICVMYADGMIGNKAIIEAIGGLTAGVYNYIRPENQSAYTLQDIIPRVYDYIYRPLSSEEKKEKAQESLKTFAFANAPKDLFKG